MRKQKRPAYTVKQVAAMSGVSVRTLHFYDEMALLKPAYTKANGYSNKTYTEEQKITMKRLFEDHGMVLTGPPLTVQ